MIGTSKRRGIVPRMGYGERVENSWKNEDGVVVTVATARVEKTNSGMANQRYCVERYRASIEAPYWCIHEVEELNEGNTFENYHDAQERAQELLEQVSEGTLPDHPTAHDLAETLEESIESLADGNTASKEDIEEVLKF